MLSTLAAALPIVVLLGSLAWLRLRAHHAALAGLVTALIVAIAVIGMLPGMALMSTALGAAFGLFPIGWIVLNGIFLHRLVERRGLLESLGFKPLEASGLALIANTARQAKSRHSIPPAGL